MRLFLLLFALTSCLYTQGSDVKTFKDLIERRVPWLADHVVYRQLKNCNKDLFELETENGKLVISANGINAATTGLNWYLKYYCSRSMSHTGDNLSAILPIPVVAKKIKIISSAKYRYALNYCTHNYTMSFYNWEDWERELDWMAMNGVNLMLTIQGMESVWQNTLTRLGYSDQEIKQFLVGPAYTAWWLMGNMEGWGGPMPQSQIDFRKDLQQKILKRMKQLGIAPVMQGFYGMVPSTLKTKSNAHIVDQGNWGPFKRPDIIDPTEKDFSRLAGIYYQEMKRIYGKDLHFFAGDPFHEGGKTENIDLGQAGRAIQAEMQRHYPKSTWILQGWQENPNQKLLASLNKDYILVQELFGEYTNNWEKRKAYEGSPFLWCVVNNFGERSGVYGKLQRFADEVYRIKKSEYHSYLKGVGIMPEGINNNPPVYDLMLELAWREEHVTVTDWINSYVVHRYGVKNDDINNAWQGFLETVYRSPEGHQEGASESIFCARPANEVKYVSHWGTRVRNYDLNKFEAAVKVFANADSAYLNVATYKLDLINMVRQVLSNRGDKVLSDIMAAYHKKDITNFKILKEKFLHMIQLTDELLNSDPHYQFNTWLEQAIKLGNTTQEKQVNLNNALMLVTYWGGNNRSEEDLHDYANKEWGGLMSDFYLKRWELYFDYLDSNLTGLAKQEPDFISWEKQWVDSYLKIQPESKSRPLSLIIKEILSAK